MDVNTRNGLFSRGEIDRIDLWPKIAEYEDQPRTFRFTFGLDELPGEPGILLIRGPRQYGKSTWLELALRDTLLQNGPGSAYFLNGDDIADEGDLERQISTLLPLFRPDARVKRLFVDEISAVSRWERTLKRLADRGELR
jgi:predicted AAA+ superfamily ATPase